MSDRPVGAEVTAIGTGLTAIGTGATAIGAMANVVVGKDDSHPYKTHCLPAPKHQFVEPTILFTLPLSL